jgi:hypothetical protein
VRVVDATSNPHCVVSSTASSVYWTFPDTRATFSPTTEYSGVGKG